jgi:hypothetical protein
VALRDLPAQATAGAPATLSLVALDHAAGVVEGYEGRVALGSDDPQALAGDATAATPHRGLLVHQFLPAEHGRAVVHLTFAQEGAHPLTLRDPDSLAPRGTQPVSVGPATGSPQPAAANATTGSSAPFVSSGAGGTTGGPLPSSPPSQSTSGSTGTQLAPAVPSPQPSTAPLVPPRTPGQSPLSLPGSPSRTSASLLDVPARAEGAHHGGPSQAGASRLPRRVPPVAPQSPSGSVERLSAPVAAGSGPGPLAQTGPMTPSGCTSDFTYTQRTLAASVGGAACTTTTQTYTSVYSFSLPASCGATGQAITVTVAGAAAGLQTSTNATCVQFVPGTTQSSVTVITGGTPDSSCGTGGAAPTVTALSPTSGPAAGGTAVTITGSGFSTTGGATATGVSCTSTSSCSATSPAGSGTVDVRVTVGGLTSAIVAADQFSYTSGTTPAVTSLSPTSGPAGGGTVVTITGTNFSTSTGATTVAFGTTAGTSVSCASTTSCTATSPAGSGTVDVRVTVGGQTSAIVTADQFSYSGGGNPMSLSGRTSDFTFTQRTLTALVAGASCASTTQTYTSAYALSLPASCGVSRQAVTVTVAGAAAGLETSSNATCLQFQPGATVSGLTIVTGGTPDTSCAVPTVSALSPTSGSAAGGTSVTVTGTGFSTVAGGTSIAFGSSAATGVSCTSSTSCTATSPAGAGVVDVRVTQNGTTSAVVAADQFSYQSPPSSFSVSASPTATNAGVPVSLTVRAVGTGGVVDPSYRGTVALSSTDPTFAPGTLSRYTFTGSDAGQHVFSVPLNTAGSQTLSVTDTTTPTITGTSAAVTVAETRYTASWGASSVQQGTPVNLSVQATDTSGHVLSGYQGTLQLSSSFGSVSASQWGGGASNSSYTFTSGDAGSHLFTPSFTAAGNETATVTDQANNSRTLTSGPITVTNAPAAASSHLAAPAALTLVDGSTLWAYLGVRGRLYVRRNVGTLAEPAWQPLVTVQQETPATPSPGNLGADSPSLALLNGTVGLFYTFTDGIYFQVWLTTSTDNGTTWSQPQQVTHESGNVQRMQTAVVGGTLSLFWSRQDTNGVLAYETTTSLAPASWSAKATVGQGIGVQSENTTSDFAITHLASGPAAGSWLLGWVAPGAVGEGGGYTNDPAYPTVHVATAPDLSTWSSAGELNLPHSQAGDRSLALSQAGSGTIFADFEQDATGSGSPVDTSIAQRTSTDGVTWAAQTTTLVDHSQPATGGRGFTAALPAFVAGSGSGPAAPSARPR